MDFADLRKVKDMEKRMRLENLKEHYAILGIQPGASLQEVRQAYVAAEKNLHAQRFADDAHVRSKAQSRLKVINEAYRAVVDTHDEVLAFLKDREGQPLPVQRERPEPVSDEASTVSPVEEKPAEVMTMDAAGNAEVGDAELSDRECGPATLPGSPDLSILRQKGILLCLAVLATLFIILLVIRCSITLIRPPAAPTVHDAAPAEAIGDAAPATTPGKTAPPATVNRAGKAGHLTIPPAQAISLDLVIVTRDAEQGNAKAQTLLGYLYTEGIGVPKDFAEAAKWFSRAAYQGDAEAQNWIGYLHETGQGVSQDYGKAVSWYRKAAGQENADAQKNLGLMYMRGKGVPKNGQEAVKWLRKAAARGNVEAQSALEIWQEE